MPLDPNLSERAQHAQRLADSVFANEECLERIDELVRSAVIELGADLAILSLSTDRQITLSAHGPLDLGTQKPVLIRGAETAFENTICSTALRSEERLVIRDARLDPRISSVPAVSEGHVRAYLGSPLRYDGALVGMLCVMSGQSRTWSAQETQALDQIAADVLVEVVGSVPAVERV